ncbi:MAG: hypothetical protein ACPGGK_03605 [Pikeienuella sp.]
MSNSRDWVPATIEFISKNLPASLDRDGWVHHFSTAYQVGCMALVALGQAEERVWGVVPRQNPAVPKELPRWDDICIAVLWLANQQNQITFRRPDGGVPPVRFGNGFVVTPIGIPPPPAPNILASNGLGPAYAQAEVINVLEKLNLVSSGQWTEAAELVLWRAEPGNWALEFTKDPRFVSSAERTAETIPDEIILEITNLLRVTEEQIADRIEWHRTTNEKLHQDHGPNARSLPVPTAAQARRSIELTRKNALDWLFFRNWRIDDGWLSQKQADAALDIFHDRLTISTRRYVFKMLYPEMPHFHN